MPPEKIDLNKLLANSIRANQKEGAKLMFELYKDFTEAGFSENQALELIKVMIVTGMTGGQNEQ